MATAYKVLKNTAKAGNSIIGAGVYSAVLQHGAPYLGKVIKISNSIQDPWLDYYYDIISCNKGNPHVPKVDKVYTDFYNEYYVVNMEELSPYAWDFEDDEDGFDRAGLAESISELIKDEVTEAEFADTWVEFEQDVFPEGFKQFFQITRQLRDQTDIKCDDDHSWNDHPDEETRKLDLHAANIMFRNNAVVITDPWCNLAVDDHPSMETYVEESNDRHISKNYQIG
jgi:hypothetical protein